MADDSIKYLINTRFLGFDLTKFYFDHSKPAMVLRINARLKFA